MSIRHKLRSGRAADVLLGDAPVRPCAASTKPDRRPAPGRRGERAGWPERELVTDRHLLSRRRGGLRAPDSGSRRRPARRPRRRRSRRGRCRPGRPRLRRRGSCATVPAAGEGISTVVLSVCDLDEGVVLGDLLPFGDEPAGDLALGQALAEVGQLELVRHRARRLPGGADPGAGGSDQHPQAALDPPERERLLVPGELGRDRARGRSRPGASAPRSRSRPRSGRARSTARGRARGAAAGRTTGRAAPRGGR